MLILLESLLVCIFALFGFPIVRATKTLDLDLESSIHSNHDFFHKFYTRKHTLILEVHLRVHVKPFQSSVGSVHLIRAIQRGLIC